jgi:hypothetical protein
MFIHPACIHNPYSSQCRACPIMPITHIMPFCHRPGKVSYKETFLCVSLSACFFVFVFVWPTRDALLSHCVDNQPVTLPNPPQVI